MGVKIVQQEIAKPLNLKGAHNVRDLGTYENKSHQPLRRHQFLRADSLHQLDEKDKETLLSYGVKAVIDLRSRMEREKAPCALEQDEKVDYYNIPMLDEMNSSGFQGKMPESMGALYVQLLEHSKREYAHIFHTMCRYPEGCVLFNCTAGKDRTGVTAMLLLKLAGVEDDIIVKDYSVSEQYMKEVFDRQREQMKQYGAEIPEYMLKSPQEEMQKTLAFFQQKYGTAEQYFTNIGMTEDEIGILKRKLCA